MVDDAPQVATSPPFLWLVLDPQVTHDFCSYRGRARKCYALLHESGGYLQGDTGPVVTSTWEEAQRQCAIYNCSIVAMFHDEKIRFARPTPNGGVTWDRVLFLVHEETARALTYSKHESHDEKPKSRKKTR